MSAAWLTPALLALNLAALAGIGWQLSRIRALQDEIREMILTGVTILPSNEDDLVLKPASSVAGDR